MYLYSDYHEQYRVSKLSTFMLNILHNLYECFQITMSVKANLRYMFVDKLCAWFTQYNSSCKQVASDSFRKKLRKVYKSVLKVCYANVLDCAVHEIIWAWYKVKLCMVNKRVTDKNVLKSFSTSVNMPICIENYFLFLTRVIYSRNQQVESQTPSLRVKSFGAVDSKLESFSYSNQIESQISTQVRVNTSIRCNTGKHFSHMRGEITIKQLLYSYFN